MRETVALLTSAALLHVRQGMRAEPVMLWVTSVALLILGMAVSIPVGPLFMPAPLVGLLCAAVGSLRQWLSSTDTE